MAIQQSLPLFDAVPQSRGGRVNAGADPLLSIGRPVDVLPDIVSPPPSLVVRPELNPHLIAARKLSRKISRLPDHSEIQTRTGQAICQHLRLMLSEMPEPHGTSSTNRNRPDRH